MANAASLERNDHPDRAAIYAEVHARPVEPLAAPARVRRVTFVSLEAGRDLRLLQERMAGLLGEGATQALARGVRQFTVQRGARRVVWELHNEFSTLTWVSPPDDWDNWPAGIGLEQHAGFPQICATRIDLIPTEQIAPRALQGFEAMSLAYSRVFNGGAEVATDFIADADGFTRMEVAAGRSGDQRHGIVVRRLLEIETYRTMALLGLPLARALSPRIHACEVALGTTMQAIGSATSTSDNQMALDKLHALAIDVGQLVEEASFRFAATKAYGALVRTRLSRLGEDAIGESNTMERYLDNRVSPALATCDAIDKRLDALTSKIARSTALLNANISLAMQAQNQAVLDTISRTAQSQYRLQQTVEGLSIIAISYYALALLGYVYEGLHSALPIEKGVLMALSAPVVVLLAWLGVQRVRRSHR